MFRYFDNKTILITGGTGSFGKEFLDYLIKNNANVNKIIIFSRDELKQYELSLKYPHEKYPQIRFFLGDIRDKSRLELALNGVDCVIHAAALKQVPAAEYNPFEFIKTNVIGAQNLIECCLNSDVTDLVALSTDKAASPINFYGATKLCSDKLFIAANNIRGKKDIKFSIVRYGNVLGSRGSVAPFFYQNYHKKWLPITDEKMTRFNISLKEGVEMVCWALSNHIGGEIFVPKLFSYNIVDMAKAFNPDIEIRIVGIRPGEKIHEEMITEADSLFTFDLGKYYVISGSSYGKTYEYYLNLLGSQGLVSKGFKYNSGENEFFLSVSQLKALLINELCYEI